MSSKICKMADLFFKDVESVTLFVLIIIISVVFTNFRNKKRLDDDHGINTKEAEYAKEFMGNWGIYQRHSLNDTLIVIFCSLIFFVFIRESSYCSG